jgi:hypothetical protein
MNVKKVGQVCGMDSFGRGYSLVASSCEHGNEPLGSIKKLRGLVRQRTIPTERPSLVGEVSANFRG